jgi:copper chaperone
MTTANYTVEGMTCSHCVAAVTAEVSAIDGVTNVDVDLASGAVAVTSDKELDRDDLRAAVEEAGYVLSE